MEKGKNNNIVISNNRKVVGQALIGTPSVCLRNGYSRDRLTFIDCRDLKEAVCKGEALSKELRLPLYVTSEYFGKKETRGIYEL